MLACSTNTVKINRQHINHTQKPKEICMNNCQNTEQHRDPAGHYICLSKNSGIFNLFTFAIFDVFFLQKNDIRE